MGRQLQLASTQEDDLQLIQIISGLVPITVFQSFADTPEALWLNDLAGLSILPSHLFIWPKNFPWVPEYKQTGGPKCPKESRGLYYISNKNIAPLLELSRSDLSKRRYGRIYWGSNFSAPYGLSYDKAAFSDLVDVVWSQIRKVAKKAMSVSSSTYWMPQALAWKARSEVGQAIEPSGPNGFSVGSA